MGYIKNEDVAGYRVGEAIVCNDCVTEEESTACKQDELICKDECEQDAEGEFFCDRCQKPLLAV